MFSLKAFLTTLFLILLPWADGNKTHNGHKTPPKIIMDNDWLASGYIPYLLALSSGWEVLGLASDTCNTWARQAGLHGLATLEVGGLADCIPVYKGSNYPLLNKPRLLHAWEYIHGALPFAGAFGADNATQEALEGGDPAGGDPNRIRKVAFVEGFPNGTFATNGSVSAAQFMVEQVQKYPGEVMIYCAGALTNVALAIRLDDTFAANTKGLVIQGGYIDGGLLGAESAALANEFSDVNLILDPEAAKIALTADWKSITAVGNVANQVLGTQEFLDEVFEVKNAYTTLFHQHYGFGLPFWDELAAAVILNPELVVNKTSFYVDVDTAYASPYYGNIRAYLKELKPKGQTLQKIDYPTRVDAEAFLGMMKKAMQYPPSCVNGKIVPYGS